MRHNGSVITAAADGSSLSNPGPAGWAWYIDDEHWAAGGWPRGTNNMGELMAVLNLLQQTDVVRDEHLHVLCDSQYVINSVSKWMPGWKRKGWKKADGKPVMNVDLLKQIDQAIAGRKVTFEWVKGHAGHDMNEAADVRARAAATAYQKGTPVDHGPGFGGAGAVDFDAFDAATSLAVEPTRPDPVEIDLFSFDEPTSDSDDVIGLEQALLSDAVRGDKARVDLILHPEFTEVGASGRLWSRARMLASIAPFENPVSFELVGTDQISTDAILVRWRSRTRGAVVLRSSLWVRTSAGWKLRFHQGTPAE